MRPFAPTNNISEAGYSSLILSATAKAGNICPPVPPPLRITRYDLDELIINLL